MREQEQRKISFQGIIKSVQPRSTVWRYRLDNRTHRTVGYNIFLTGIADGEEKDFAIAISEKQQEKYKFHIGDEIKGTGWTEKYPLKKLQMNNVVPMKDGSPWVSEVPELAVYDWRGCRMLDKKCWSGKCFQCKWACMANVTIEYNWGVTQKHRFESFCYGPKNCKLYKMGKPRAVPYKDCGSSYDEGWLDEICTENRDDEE